MLLAPASGDITRSLGSVSSLPSSGDEATGFAEQLSLASSAMDEANPDVAEENSAAESVPVSTEAGISTPSMASSGNGNTSLGGQPSLTGPPPAPLAETAVPPTTDKSSSLAAAGKRSVSAIDARPRPKEPVGRSNENAGNNDRPNGGQSQPYAMLTMLSGTPVGANYVPAKNATPLQTAPLAGPGTATQQAFAHGSAPLLREQSPAIHLPPADQATSPAVLDAPATSTNDPTSGNTGEIAFAVKVARPGSSLPGSRTSAGEANNTSNATAGQTSSGKTAATATESAETRDGSETNGGGQAKDNNADQPAAVNDASAKADEKKPVGEVSPQQDTAVAASSFAIGACSDGSPADVAGAAGKSASSMPDVTAPDNLVAADQLSRPAGPMKDISVRVENSQGQNVDVRIVQRSGDLQIAVKSASVDTTQGLRNGLSELTSRLNASGYQAETWRPGPPPASASESAAGSGNSPDQPPSRDSHSNSGWSQQNQGQHDNNPSNRPRWISELESKLTGGAESTGQFHGFVS